MSTRRTGSLVAALLLLSACSSTDAPAVAAQEPLDAGEPVTGTMPYADGDERVVGPQPADEPEAAVETAETDSLDGDAPAAPVRVGPAPWTGAFGRTAVMVARNVRIEGPSGLLEHVVASSDDALYERSVETTPDGLVQVVRRADPDAREIRVQIDAWTVAALDSVVILERVDGGPARVVAQGEALWRDVDSHLLQGERLEFRGEIGDETPFDPTAHPAFGSDGAGDAGATEEASSVEDAAFSTQPGDVGEGIVPSLR